MDSNTADVIGTLAIAAATFVLSGVTAYVGHNYRRKVRIELASARLTAFGKLFEVTGLAAPTRLAQAGEAGVLTPEERDRLYQELTDWYYQEGNGMLLEGPTRDVYMKAKRNLTCSVNNIDPQGAWLSLCSDMKHDPTTDSDRLRGLMSMRQLSLLRSQLKSELAVFGNRFTGTLADHEHLFLQACNVALDKEPWKEPNRRSRHTERIHQLTADVKPLAIPNPSAPSSSTTADGPAR